jgi:hypothetical protein
MSSSTTAALLVTIAFSLKLNVKVDINELIDQLKSSEPIVPEDLDVNTSDEVQISDNVSASINSTVKATGSLSIIKTTNNPDPKELELIQASRGNRPYNSIFDVHISYDEKGNITSLQWSEN